jgi:hypothetical protein
MTKRAHIEHQNHGPHLCQQHHISLSGRLHYRQNPQRGCRLPHPYGGQQVIDNLPWGIVILFGGGFALARGFQRTGLSTLIGQNFTGIGQLHPIVMVLIICTASADKITRPDWENVYRLNPPISEYTRGLEDYWRISGLEISNPNLWRLYMITSCSEPPEPYG